ncbi:MAG: homocysteine S-methyltransferase family protein [Eubacteriales bacterium]|nr:homocysteine S-methyltransferase family protein [Eubacteriales bacterium]
MEFLQALRERLLFFDGAMGTLLQEKGLAAGDLPERWVLAHPETVRGVHAAYYEAGADIIKTCTFGNNACKLKHAGLSVGDVSREAVRLARDAVSARGHGYVALDVGPIGRLLRPLGDLGFEEAVDLFKEHIAAGAKNADLVLIETMTDAYELKAAVLAAKESCDLPVIATVSPDVNSRMLTGADMAAVVSMLEGLRVDALGLNCGRGPAELFPLLESILSLSSIPVAFSPNAGLPHGTGKEAYTLSPEAYASHMKNAALAGSRLLGGCCGTSPDYIRHMIQACAGLSPLPVTPKHDTVICGYGRAVRFADAPVLIGERINPTGKPKLKAALKDGDHALILQEAVRQQESGAQVLDVNAGLPDIDEASVLEELVTKIQGVCELPLQLDTANTEALSRALRIYNGKPMINSVTGAKASMDAVFPLAKKYGAVIVALTLDEKGIPETADGRFRIAERILARAAEYGIDKKDIIVDALTMTASAAPQNGGVTLATLRRVKTELGVKTSLGVSNISFGLPNRELLNAAFFTLAVGAGLDAAIVNPYSVPMLDAFRACNVLLGNDPGCASYIGAYAQSAAAPAAIGEKASLGECVYRGLREEAVRQARAHSADPLGAIDREVIPALDRVGQAYEAGKLFLPGLLMSAEAAKAALFELCPSQSGGDAGDVIVATVKGDVHDIGKNIAASMLSSYRFHVIDLGRDVTPETILDAVKARKAKLVGLSALMTTTVVSMRETVALLKKEAPLCRIMVGGAVLTPELAADMGADRYVKDAMASVRYAKEVLG